MSYLSRLTSPGAGRQREDDCGLTAVHSEASRSRAHRTEGRLAEHRDEQAKADLQSTTRALKPSAYLSQRY